MRHATFLLGFSLFFFLGQSVGDATFSGAALLPEVLKAGPIWLNIPSGSDQGLPVYVGATPREMVVEGKRKPQPEIPKRLKALGEEHLAQIQEALGKSPIEIEAWPASHWKGHLTWAFARWREPGGKWEWLEEGLLPTQGKGVAAELPKHFRSWVAEDQKALFSDFLELSDLYAKPLFSHCVWTTEEGTVVAGWLAPAELGTWRPKLTSGKYHGYALPPPARFNEEPTAFVVRIDGGVQWDSRIRWAEDSLGDPTPDSGSALVSQWPAQFEEHYRKDLEIFSGEAEAIFPISGKRARFVKKNSAEPDHQLETLVNYLEERYQVLGIPTERQRFMWRGIPQSNLIARIAGSRPAEENRPVVLMDHIDTAFAEDLFEKTGERVSVPGADDNATAVAAVLRAAETLKHKQPLHDIWLVHMTGEEFPGDCLGARHFIGRLLEKKQDLSGVIVWDMIGWRKVGDPVFQVNAGHSLASLKLAGLVLGAAEQVAPDLRPEYRSRFDDRSYLYNTDGLFFSEVGYPVVLINEHLNAQKMDHPYYHQSTDTVAHVDVPYAVQLTQVGIEAAARLAHRP